MRIAVCVSDTGEREQLVKWLNQYCTLYGLAPDILSFSGAETLFEAHSACRFELVFMGLGGPEGFLHARHLRELDKYCKVVYMDDTAEYAVKSVRLHFTDYIIRPLDFKKVVRAVKLAGV